MTYNLILDYRHTYSVFGVVVLRSGFKNLNPDTDRAFQVNPDAVPDPNTDPGF
jgi:hypothetical protein